MKRVLCPQLPKPGHSTPLPESEADHLIRVLRLRDGDVIEALDGQGRSAIVTLRVRGGGPRIEFRDSPNGSMDKALSQLVPPVILEVAVLKGEAMEWVVEKAVELGVRILVPTLTTHTVVQVKGKGPEAFRERWQKIADQALKQCGRLERLQVERPLPLEEVLANRPATSETPRLWFDEAGRDETPFLLDWIEQTWQQPLKSIQLLIGPEGGWSEAERDRLRQLSQDGASSSGMNRLSLGPWILRGETAALFAASLASARFRAHPAAPGA